MTDLLVADSFLVDDGRVRGLDLHRERFTTSCARYGVDVTAFWPDAVARLPRGGRWFPRMELTTDLRPALRTRPAPPLAGPVRVTPYTGPDPRRHPFTKGPDLPALGALRSAPDEILLTTRAGLVLEAAYSALLWWENDTLCVPPSTLPLLPSITVGLLRTIAATRDVEVAERPRTLADLDRREAWLANALHGIRPITSWPGTAITPAPPANAPSWQAALTAQASPLP